MKRNLLFVLLMIFFNYIFSQCPSNTNCPAGYTFVSGAVIDVIMTNGASNPATGEIDVDSGPMTVSGYMLNTSPQIDMTITIGGDNVGAAAGSDLKDNLGAFLGNEKDWSIAFSVTSSGDPIYFTNIPLRLGDFENEVITAFSVVTSTGTTSYGSGTWNCFEDVSNIEVGQGGSQLIINGGNMESTYTNAGGYTLNTTGDLPISTIPVSEYSISTGTGGGGSVAVGFISGTAINGACIPSSLLPVELLDFRVKALQTGARLNWSVNTETDNEGFEIEHSLNSRTWETVGFVPGKGTTFEKQSYSFLHKNPAHGVNYYRLKQMDFDGAFEYSDIVSVQYAVGSMQLAVSPNPVQNGEVTLYIPETDFEEANLEIYNSRGVLVQTERLYSNQTTIRTADLPKGMYLFSVKVGRQRLIKRVVVN